MLVFSRNHNKLSEPTNQPTNERTNKQAHAVTTSHSRDNTGKGIGANS